MPNNPVQIILNDGDFLRAPDPGRSGPSKDFFENADAAFVAHRASLVAAIEAIIATIDEAEYGPATYLKVRLRDEALMKPYRPSRILFREEQFACVGSDGMGILYFRAPRIHLDALKTRILETEPTVPSQFSRDIGEPLKAPSRARSEVGAIAAIEIAPPMEKRAFSTSTAMRMFEDPRTVSGYQIELFEMPGDRAIADDPLGRYALLASLQDTLLNLGPGSRILVSGGTGRMPLLELQITTSGKQALIDGRLGIVRHDATPALEGAPVDIDPERHEVALNALARHPLVRSIRPPVQLELVDWSATTINDGEPADMPVKIPKPSAQSNYPKIGVIDSGIAEILGDWVIDRFDSLDASEHNPKHGTQVAGIAVAGQSVNKPTVAPEADGCMIYDAPLYPSKPLFQHFLNGFGGFLEELEQAVIEAKEKHGVRVFNLSLSATSHVEPSKYSPYAARLDEIADTHGVIFVNSAGNLPPGQGRAAWHGKPADVISYFATRTHPDTIYKPSESVRAISVGAINPPGTHEIEGAPTRYTTRGPGLQVGVKPDVAAYGGTAAAPGQATGLSSISIAGHKIDVAGTSYAAPLVSRCLAGLDAATGGVLAPETVRAMLLHHTTMPPPLMKRTRGMKDLARQFVGFGQPGRVTDMLETDDHQITVVFESRLTIGQRKPAILRFDFPWPRSLVESSGACSGRARMTLVYAPPLDPAFGPEFVRVNLEGALLQRRPRIRKTDGKPSYANRISPRYPSNTAGLGIPEKALVTHGLKWWPSKQYEATFRSKGECPDWRLEVTSMVRAEASFPPEGVPFTVILTIEDPDGAKPVFAEMHQALDTGRARTSPIRTVAKVLVR